MSGWVGSEGREYEVREGEMLGEEEEEESGNTSGGNERGVSVVCIRKAEG